MKSKKGTNLISIYWFLVLGIIVAGVIIMTNVFYSSPYDVRALESELLANHIANCISPGGEMHHLLVIQGRVFPAFGERFEKNCNLNFAGKEELKVEEFYVSVEGYIDNSKTSAFNFSAGNKNWKTDCESEDNFKKLAVCFERTYYSYDKTGKSWKIKVLSAVAKVQDNIK
jgi:hypothetical protein